MPDLTLYHFPMACSRVTMAALEETGLPYADSLVQVPSGQQRTAEYLAVNPNGKIPALRVGDAVLTENSMILAYLDQLAPNAGLLPKTDDPVARAQHMADLVWVATTLHPNVRHLLAPFRMTDGDTAGIKAKGHLMMAEHAARISARLEAGGWWYGSDWSIMDVYIFWVFSSAQVGGFDLSPYPRLIDHAERVRARPSFQRVMARETEVLDRAGVKIPTALPSAPVAAAAH